MVIDRTQPEGNSFAIMGIVYRLLRATGRESEIDAVLERMKSGDYENLCKVATEVSYGVITFCDGDDDADMGGN